MRTRTARREIVAVVGPTASGKSEIAYHVARSTGGEVVSADSMALYRGMDIGTAKPSKAMRDRVPHHLLDVAGPSERFSAAAYQAQSRAAIDDIHSRGKTVVLAGGTGLYIKSALDDLRFPPPSSDSEVDTDAEEMYRRLLKIDPVSAGRVDRANPRRLKRALEIAETGADTAARDFKTAPALYDAVFFGIAIPRAILYERIEARVDRMIEAGLVEEVRRLTSNGRSLSLTAAQALGYKEIISHLKGESSMDEAVAEIKLRTRRLAKRQMTWFRADPRVQWIDLTGEESAASVAQTIIELYQAKD